MADATISVVLERIAATIEEQIRNEVRLVRGVKKEIRSLSDELKTVRNVLEDAEKKRYKEKSIKDWLTRLENTTFEMDDVLDEWNYSICKFQMIKPNPNKNKVLSCIPSSCLCFKKVSVHREIALKIKDVKERLDLILAEKDRFGFTIESQPCDRESWRGQTTSFIDLEEVRGRYLEREDVVSKLVGEEGLIGGIRVISIVGVGGIGKTTLAQLAYNDIRVEKCFDLKIWICVSDPFDVFGIADGIIEKAGGSKPNSSQLDMLLHCLRESISGKKFLLVLDDVWTEDETKWKPLKIALNCGGLGSKVLVTTRNERVAVTMMGEFIKNDQIHRLGVLNDEDCWSLFCRIALCDKNKDEWEEFENTGKKIANKCRGLPLAIKTLSSVLRFKKTLKEWESVLSSEVWELEKIEVELFPHLLLSYNELSPTLKRCFSYCAVFPKDTEIDVESLIRKWMALGYLGSNSGDWKVRGREYFDQLAMRSLFQDFKKDDDEIKSFMMHDIVHDFAQFLRKNVGSRMKETTCENCIPFLVSEVEKYRSLFKYCRQIVDPHVCDCLTSVRLLSLRKCRLKGISEEIEKLIHLRWLDLGFNEFGGGDLKFMCKLYNLQFLWVDSCELQAIPPEIGNLSQLIHLDLRGNRFSEEDFKAICKLYNLQFLRVEWCGLQAVPLEIGNLSQLIHLELSYNKFSDEDLKAICKLSNLQFLRLVKCELQAIPVEIGNLSELIHLNLSDNTELKVLPESLCNLIKLESLVLDSCESLVRLPEGIHRLKKLKHLYNQYTHSLEQYPQGIAQLTNLVTLEKFLPCDGSQLGWLKNLNRLRGNMLLEVKIGSGVDSSAVEEAREAGLRNKMHIQGLEINFVGSTTEFPNLQVKDTSLVVWNDVLDALEPHRNLQELSICHYNGSRLPGWIESPLNQLSSITILDCKCLWSLPPLGQLPLLEILKIWNNPELEYVGREFLGIATTSSVVGTTTIIGHGFPKLRELKFVSSQKWNKWEDISAEEEEEEYSIMPCLTKLTIYYCNGLTELPQRLLRKVSPSLKVLNITRSTQLEQVYGDKEGQPWKSISRHNPHLLLYTWNY